MIIIEIALGIVLAVIILNYWQDIIGWGILAVIGSVIIAALAGVSYFIYSNWDSLAPILALLLIVVCFVIGMMILHKVCEFLDERLSRFTIKMWNVTGGESIAILFMIITLTVGIFFVLKAVITENPPHNNLPIGCLLIFIGGLIYNNNIKNSIKKTRAQRIIQKTYEK